MKPWQHGIDIEILKSHEKRYEKYNAYSLSPFAQVKKNNIAQWMNDREFLTDSNGRSYTKKTAKVNTSINMHGDTFIARVYKGDIIIKNVSDFPLDIYFSPTKNYWLHVWAEDTYANEWALASGFVYIGGKITTFGEIYSIYLKASNEESIFGIDDPRIVKVDPVEYIDVKKLGDFKLPKEVFEQIKTIDSYQNHYSNYNKKKSWSALALRGYSNDPLMIEKPIEMNDRWHENHEGQTFELQNTPLMDHFPELRDTIASYRDVKFHRIRLMKLTPGGGELTRHTDQVDPESYNTIGGLIRLHLPIVTNPNVDFTVWSVRGEEKIVNMKVGEIWMLDTRKPHRVINNGTIDRIHLVIDVQVNKTIYDIIRR